MKFVEEMGSLLGALVAALFILWIVKQLVSSTSLQGKIGDVSFSF